MNRELFKDPIKSSIGIVYIEVIEGLVFTQTCDYAPEQYDIETEDGEYLAYARVDDDYFTVDHLIAPKKSQIIYYFQGLKDWNKFDGDIERLEQLTKAAKAVKKYYEQRI